MTVMYDRYCSAPWPAVQVARLETAVLDTDGRCSQGHRHWHDGANDRGTILCHRPSTPAWRPILILSVAMLVPLLLVPGAACVHSQRLSPGERDGERSLLCRARHHKYGFACR